MKTARQVAAEALVKQEQGGYSNLVLDAALRAAALSPRDQAFCSAVFYGVLERQNTLDFCLGRCLQKPLTKLDAPVRALLRSGLYQLRYMQVPPSAAVNETVALTRRMGKTSAAGLVNAVLRRAAGVQPERHEFQSEAEWLAVSYSVARPVAQLFLEAYPGRAQGILEAFFEKAPTALRANTLKTDAPALVRALREEGAQAEVGPLPGSVLAVLRGSPTSSAAFGQGLFHVQGLSSQLAALCLGVRGGQKVLDLCAAPGGKTLLLAQQMQNSGRLFSCDAAPNRLPLIQKALDRCGVANASVLLRDASQPDARLAGADRVLCDVPCSGLGILGKKPDLRYKDLTGLDGLCGLQGRILRTAAGYVKPGGRLVYSTCTLNPAENERQIEAFLREAAGTFSLAAPAYAPPQAQCGPYGMTIFPDGKGFDGFFIATLERL